MYPGSRPLLHIHICACKFRLNVKPAITTILPACRCRHRDETARDSGPGRSDKPGCHPTQTQPRGTKNHDSLEAKRLPQPAQNSNLVINVHGATFDLPTPDADVLDRSAYMANEYCNLLTRTPERAGKPGRATHHASTTHGSIFLGQSGENSPGRHRQILHIRRTTKMRHHALARDGHTRDRNRRPSCPTPRKWP